MTTTVRQYTSQEVIELTGCTYRQLDYWASRGLVNDTARGTGTPRTFTLTDVETIYHAVRLIHAGFAAGAAAPIAAELVESGSWSGEVDGLHIVMSYSPESTEQPQPTEESE